MPVPYTVGVHGQGATLNQGVLYAFSGVTYTHHCLVLWNIHRQSILTIVIICHNNIICYNEIIRTPQTLFILLIPLNIN